MDQLGIFDATPHPEGDEARSDTQTGGKRRGPPNRLNDLAYRDWMKFQKSFFRFDTWTRVVDECIQFFTKRVWPDGRPSSILIVGFDDAVSTLTVHRGVEHIPASQLSDIERALAARRKDGALFDFVMVDLRVALDAAATRDAAITRLGGHVFREMRALLRDEMYCSVVVAGQTVGGGGFPTAWAVSLAARDEVRLRDEKIGIDERTGEVHYCLFFQAVADALPARVLTKDDLQVAEDPGVAIPGWIIPRPPPRKKGELLHPAKFPETLIAEFIDLFSKPRDTVLDPMMGTGSAVIAAIRENRIGYGVELSPDFHQIAANRIEAEVHSLFDGGTPGIGHGVAYLGDATRLDLIPELKRSSIGYAITSPPYWSMLSNPGSENQRARRQKGLPTVYSESSHDLGNVTDYAEFLNLLIDAYEQVALLLRRRRFLTIIVKNVKRDHIVYPLAWDLTMRLCGPGGPYEYGGNTFWCQDDVSMKPFAVGTHWVSNTVHQYCLHFRKR